MPTGSADNVHIGLLWHSATSGNLGVGALTLADMALLREAGERAGLPVRFTLFQMRDSECPPIVGPDVAIQHMNMRYLLASDGFARTLQGIDLVVDIGAGDSFAEIYARKRFFMLWFSKYRAVRAKVPLILAPQTIGPFTKQPYKRLAGWIMDRATAVVARDRVSLDVAKRLAPRAKVALAADVAFALPFSGRSAERHASGGSERLRVGFNISGLLHAAATAGRNPFGLDIDYAAFADQLMAQLTERDDIDLFLVTHATSGQMAEDDDGSVADAFAARYPGVNRVPDFTHPSDAKSFISSLDFLIASRMHACIAACSAGVPFIPVAYSRKFAGVFGLIGYDHEVPVRGKSTEQAVAYVLAALDRRDELANEVAAAVTRTRELLDGYVALAASAIAAAVGKTGEGGNVDR